MLSSRSMYQRACLGRVGVGPFAKNRQLAALPELCVHVHALAVVAEHRLA